MDGKLMTDEQLEKVSGGYYFISESYPTPDMVVYKWKIGDHVEKVRGYGPFNHVYTTGCTVLDRKPGVHPSGNGYCAYYLIKADEPENNNHWFAQENFEHGYTSINHADVM